MIPCVSQRRKLIIECGGPSGKKHSFVTESSKIAQYLLNLCSAQHKFHSEMTSRQLNHSVLPGGNISSPFNDTTLTLTMRRQLADMLSHHRTLLCFSR